MPIPASNLARPKRPAHRPEVPMSRRILNTRVRPLVLIVALASMPTSATGQAYWPGTHLDWDRKSPQEAGFDPVKIREAVQIAIAGESTSPRDLAFNHRMTFGREPHGEPVGPFTVRARQTGLIVHKGYIIAEWGDPHKVDNTFSVSKSFLSTTVGLAYDRGLIRDVHDLVRPYVAPIVLESEDGEPKDQNGRRPKLLFESDHNRKITWDHLLRQTSDWEGTLWGKPEWADRPSDDRSTWGTRPRFEPGTRYEYNDTRVNLLALVAASVWRRPLPEVLREYVMDPIGASPTWRWHGYDNSWVILDGRAVQSVSGGAHWGGGMLLSTFDQARFGRLHEPGVESAANSELNDFLGTPGAGQVHGPGNAHRLAADDYLLSGVDVGHPDAGFARHFFERHLVQTDDRGHGSGVLVACFLHEGAPHVDQASGFGDVENAGDRERRVLAQAVAGHHDRLRHLFRIQVLFHRLHASEADSHDAGLGVDGLPELVFGAFEKHLGQRSSERIVDLLEYLSGRG